MSLLPGLEVAAGSTHPEDASSEEGSPEEVVPSMPQDSGPGAHQSLNSTDLDVHTEAVTCEYQGTRVWGGNMQGCPRKSNHSVLSGVQCSSSLPCKRPGSRKHGLSLQDKRHALPPREKTGVLGRARS